MDGGPDRLKLSPPGVGLRGERARLYVRWMPHLGAEAVALYELLRVLPEIGLDQPSARELAELLKSDTDSVRRSLKVLAEANFITDENGWTKVSEHPPTRASDYEAHTEEPKPAQNAEVRERRIELVRPEPEGVSADDYFRYMGNLPAPHIVEFLNNYTSRDEVEPDVIREALRIASERDARRVGYVRSILESWVERGVKTMDDVRRYEKDRKLRLVEQSGAVKGGAAKIGKGVGDGANRRIASRHEEGYEWLFGRQEEK